MYYLNFHTTSIMISFSNISLVLKKIKNIGLIMLLFQESLTSELTVMYWRLFFGFN